MSTNAVRGRGWIGRIVAIGALGAAVTALALGIGAWRSRGLVDAGAALVSDEAYLPAARALTRAVVAAPRDARAHYYLGLAYAGLGEDEAALRHVRDAVRLAPREPRYETGLATVLLDGGHVAEAVAHLRRAADLAPGSAAVRLLLADTLRRAGDLGGMEREYRNAMHLAPGGALATIARQQLKVARGRAAP